MSIEHEQEHKHAHEHKLEHKHEYEQAHVHLRYLEKRPEMQNILRHRVCRDKTSGGKNSHGIKRPWEKKSGGAKRQRQNVLLQFYFTAHSTYLYSSEKIYIAWRENPLNR
jgi:hypothetical protein